MAHHRRRVVHVNVTETPTAQWTAQPLLEAFPWDTAPRYVLRDRDAVYGAVFSSQLRCLGIREVTIAPRSPWQNPYVERFSGTLRRECLDHVVVLRHAHLRRVLRADLAYDHEARTPRSLGKDAPEPRSVERPDRGRIVATPMVGGLHHRYTRRAASSPAGGGPSYADVDGDRVPLPTSVSLPSCQPGVGLTVLGNILLAISVLAG